MSKSKVGVALVKEACPICARLYDGPILINTRLTEARAEEVEEMHGKTIGMMDKPCEECQELMNTGFLLIGYDESKTDDESNPYRTGCAWVITHEAAMKIFNADLSAGVAFIDIETAEHLKLPMSNTS